MKKPEKNAKMSPENTNCQTWVTGDDIICCQITSEARFDEYAIVLNDNDFKEGSLQQTSLIRPNRIFTADQSIISYKTGRLKEKKIEEIESGLVKIFTL